MRALLLKSALIATIVALLVLWLFAETSGRAGAVAFVSPFLSGWQKIETAVRQSACAVWPWGRSSAAKIRDLEAQLRLARIQLAQVDDLRRENTELRQLANLPPIPDWEVVFADVIARDPVVWNQGFRIGRGRRHGVMPGCAVLSGPFLIGRVTECGKNSATVTTLASQACRLGVVLERGKETGVLRGRGDRSEHAAPECLVDYLPKETVADPGDMVWTSGLGRSLPGGLIVGRVADDGRTAVEIVDGAYVRVRVTPLAQFGHLRVVAVICAKPAPETGVGAGSGP